jgi:hypothetical protein
MIQLTCFVCHLYMMGPVIFYYNKQRDTIKRRALNLNFYLKPGLVGFVHRRAELSPRRDHCDQGLTDEGDP